MIFKVSEYLFSNQRIKSITIKLFGKIILCEAPGDPELGRLKVLRSHPGPHSLGLLRSSAQKAHKACDFRKVAGTPSRGELGISIRTVIDPGVRVSAQSPAANSMTFGWSSNMAKLVAEHKTETLNKDQGQVKVRMRPMTSHKPSHVRSFLLREEPETSCFRFGQDH